ncbi:collagen alpha-2(I) chain-like [Anopheles ziemanni]|uniref:collagen alpha-2(I) chain-like n=1 Tax=Anopheles coustani TaxID=139045 RepID=UPI002657DE55|nr:collagen alpha-2(I) chain-like [Anopheles coustani]XP_058177679.1 collagen alpha-2(I) chain-like [Anopheles ziemanni]
MSLAAVISIVLLVGTALPIVGASGNQGAKTFPGASLVLPAVLPIVGTIIPALLPGLGPPGIGGGPGSVGLPGVSVSHSTSIATSVHNRPIAISHSGSVSTIGNTDAGSAASVGSHHGSVSAQSSAQTSRKSHSANGPLLSKRWRKLFKKLG